MNQAQIINKILNSKGNFVRAAWRSNTEPAAKFKDISIEKRTSAIVRAGINFANLQKSKGRETEPLPYGEWFKFPYVIKHNNTMYLRLYSTESEQEETYFVDGKEVDKETFRSYLTPSAAKKLDEEKDCFNIKLENVIGTEEL